VVNIAMALLVPILGRRDVIKKISFGLAGNRGSALWMLTGPATFALHLISNAIAARLIKSTPGFGSVPIGQLVLLWSTRPRAAWMIVALLPYQAREAIYFSVVTSTLLSEVLLQAIGAYYMFSITNYGRMQKFYSIGRLTGGNIPHGHDALLMYAGAVLWVCAIFFAVGICLWSILGVSNHISSLAMTLRGLTIKVRMQQRQLENLKHTLYKEEKRFASLKIAIPFPKDIQHLEAILTSAHVAAREALDEYDALWSRFEVYRTTDLARVQSTERELRRLQKLAESAKGHTSNSELRDIEHASDQHETALGVWRNTPEEQVALINGNESTWKTQREGIVPHLRQVDTLISKSTTSKDTYHTMMKGSRSLQMELLEKDGSVKLRDIVRSDNVRRHKVDPSRLPARKSKESPSAFASRLEGPQDSQGDHVTIKGLEILYLAEVEKVKFLTALCKRLIALDSVNDAVYASRETLLKYWGKQKKKLEKKERNSAEGAMLRKIAWRTIGGMLACWIAQWIWWTGYIRVSGDS
jgi:hypothetical protein